MRITMGMVMKQYNNNLNNSLNALNEASLRETTLRKFNKASEDPFSASKAFLLRREYLKNDSYQSELSDTSDQLLTAQSAMTSIHNVIKEASSGDCIQAINGTMSASDRTTIATKLRALQQTILSPANTQFGDKYVFSGSATSEPPFTVGADGNLLYRGIDVNTGKIEAGSTLSYNGAQITLGDAQFNGYKIQVNTADGATPSVSADTSSKTLTVNLPTGAKNSDILTALKTAPSLTASNDSTVTFDLSKAAISGDLNCPVDTSVQTATATDTIGAEGLKQLANEQSYVNIGLGLSTENGSTDINSQSVFNSAIPGISFLGYGTVDGTENGVSNNLYTLLGQIADKLEGKDGSTFSMDEIKPYLDNLSKQGDALLSKITESGTKSNFLTTTLTNLESMGDKVMDKIDKTEYVDFEDAVMDQIYQQYAYSAALKVGAQILQPTFLDFMK
ncbi:flagellar hook-associated protein FlgL [Caproiciproducens faecalis]|uniref:Flagellar hook-associated protein FlgL n=1 Tax=Caproiciproducens faecalis TaxID=2820301 RepID=A0ABS7DPV9_9FIRM|nr:flagellar hook-associated protein FlgL [Caproiciproducens faecalis]MBW7573341.1 flagellar hook-associated protein FlgL [Caproiciproducens faecalis]